MKKAIKSSNIMLVVGVIAILTIASCKYNDVVPTNYPEQTIYMTTAAVATKAPNANGFYEISNIAVPGQDFRYTVNLSTSKFIIPLGITRAGAELKDEVKVGLTFNSDTITKLKAQGRLASDVEFLPTTSSNIPPTTVVADGSTSSTFALEVNLPYLLSNPNKKYAVAVAISDAAGRRINKSLNTTVVLINTTFLIPVTNFSFAADINTARKINFTNTSLYGLTYAWDFGDGTPMSTEKSPVHTYNSGGTYSVKLVTVGVTGETQKSTKVSSLVIN